MRAWGFATALGGDRLVSRSADPAPLLEHEREACEAPLPGVAGPRTFASAPVRWVRSVGPAGGPGLSKPGEYEPP